MYLIRPYFLPDINQYTFLHRIKSRAKKKGLDEFAIKRLVGHAISDITERVYTERDVEWLRTEVNKL